MQIHISFDYELFFGSSSGSIQKCIIEPTQKLIEISSKYKVPFIFYVDAGYLNKIKNNLHNALCLADFELITKQLRQLSDLGHEIGLHIHPHWEDCTFENNKWNINTTRYKLACFTEKEVENIITKYHQTIIDIIGKPCKSYRAGGWCVQPFDSIKKALIKNNIFIDSSVYYKGFHKSEAHAYNFLNAPNKTTWKFESDPSIVSNDGQFNEIAITYDKIPALFYWNLYFKMKSNPIVYKPIGDGNWLVDKKRIYKHFYTPTNHFACADGFFASRLPSILKRLESEKKDKMMVLSHPKSMASYSFQTLDNFISVALNKGHQICKIV